MKPPSPIYPSSRCFFARENSRLKRALWVALGNYKGRGGSVDQIVKDLKDDYRAAQRQIRELLAVAGRDRQNLLTVRHASQRAVQQLLSGLETTND